MTLKNKHESLQTILKELGRVVVAYSGGVDSSYLLKAAVDALGRENVLACISLGPSEPGNMAERARKTAEDVGAELMVVQSSELDDPHFKANNADRCFHCKSHLCRTLLNVARERGFPHVVFGTNFDDLDDFRPGNKATKLHGVRSPLAEAGLTKNDIRELSRQAGLSTANQPASPCLASRIPYGLEVTEQRLKQVDQAEGILRSFGFVEFRVRHHDKIARIEVRPQDVATLVAEPVRTKVVERLKGLGFQFITMDLQGFRSGSLNESLSDEQKRTTLGV
jgi:uncharacterized protein